MHRLLAIGLTCLVAAAASADVTYWQADPSEPGNWFLAENWTQGVPGSTDWAYVQNGGTAVIGIRPGDALAEAPDPGASRGATANFLNIGGPGGGTVSQVWLHTDIGARLFIGARANVPALYKLSGGSLAAGRIQVGWEYNTGEFAQTGGIARTDRLTVGAWPCCWTAPSDDLYLPPNRFTLTGGEFYARDVAIGAAAIGRAVQKGGLLAVDDLLKIGGSAPWPPTPVLPPLPLPGIVDLPTKVTPNKQSGSVTPVSAEAHTNVYICPPPPSEGRYDLMGGRVQARRIHVGRTGTVVQTGGAISTRYLAIDRGGAWTYADGRLEAADGITCDGVLDFAGSETAIKAEHGLFNFGRGKLGHTDRAAMDLGRESLAIFPRGFNPYQEFGSFHSSGIVHTAGRDLYIRPGRGVVGWGRIDDFTVVGGYLQAALGLVTPNLDGVAQLAYIGRIDLERGLMVRGGKVDLGHGSLQVRDRRSGIFRGGLHAQRMVVGKGLVVEPVPIDALLEQDAPASADVSPYGHVLRPRPGGRFTQWSGDVRLDHLAVTNGLYLLNRGTLVADHAEVGGPSWGPGAARFIQRGGETSFGTLRVGQYPRLWWGITNALDANTIADPLRLPEAADPRATLVPWPPPHDSRVHVSGGRLKARTIDLRGWTGRATFTQTGGYVEATERLRIDGNEATYTLLGGGLTTGYLDLGYPYAMSASNRLATLALLSPAANVRVTERMTLGHGSRLLARRGAAIHLTGTDNDTGTRPGTTFDILSTNERALAGLNDLALVFEGGIGGWSTLEVGGVDYGFSNQGFFENFALEELHVGGEADAALLRLVDLVDNQPDWTGDEALYVERLFITEGSWLDPAGLNIYYLEGHFPDVGGLMVGGDGGGSGGGPALLPEPATLALLAAGLAALRRRRRAA